MLFAGIEGVIDRGPVFQLGIAATARKEARAFERPSELRGDPPYEWNLDGEQYTVKQITILGLDNKIGLIFRLPHRHGSASRMRTPRIKCSGV